MRRLTTWAIMLVVMLVFALPAGAQGKIATIIFTQELDTLNPIYSNMWFSLITREIWLQSAISFDKDLNPVPSLVTEVPSLANGGISEDGTVITYHLREGLTWSDGEALTSSDFIFTYNMILADSNTVTTRYPYEAEIVASVEAPDDLTVVVTFVEPFAPWLTTVFTYILPEHILAPVFEADGSIDEADWNRAPTVGVGPFIFSEWESGSHILFSRNENYWSDVTLDGIFIRFVPDDASQIAALSAGDGDIGTFISYADYPQLQESGVEPEIVASGYNETWFFNIDPETAHPAMLDVNVRTALQMAFDRNEITESLLLGYTYPAGTFWEGTPFDNPDIEPVPYDPEGAAALLDEAGWVDSDGDGIRDKDGVKLELRYSTPPRQIRMDTQVVVQQDFAELGIGLILENPSYDIFFNSYGSGGPIALGEYDISQYSTTGSFPDPDTAQFLCSEIPSEDNPEGINDTHYCDEETDALFAQARTTVDFEARKLIYFDIAQRMHDAHFWTGVWYDPDTWAVNARLQNVAINGATPFWNCAVWDIVES